MKSPEKNCAKPKKLSRALLMTNVGETIVYQDAEVITDEQYRRSRKNYTVPVKMRAGIRGRIGPAP